MLLTLGAALIALTCVIAAAMRLAWAVAPTRLDPRALLAALGDEREGDAALLAGLRRELADDPSLMWERDLLAALDEPAGPSRDALVNEQLLDFEARVDRGVRVPRVCASIGTSAGLLFGSLALLQGLGDADGGDNEGAHRRVDAALHAALSSALGAVALGIAATSFCVAVHIRARKASRARRAAVDGLVARLERVEVMRSVSDANRRST